MHLKSILSIVILLCLFAVPVFSQGSDTDTTKTAESVMLQKRKNRFVFMPAISYSPETAWTLGGFFAFYYDLAKGDTTVPMSAQKLIAIYTTNNGFVFEPRWDIFTAGGKYVIRGRTFVLRYPDRHYGWGNDANARVIEYPDSTLTGGTTVNYLTFTVDKILFESDFLRKVAPNVYVGLNYQFERLSRYRINPNHEILTPEEFGIDGATYDPTNPEAPYPLLGNRSGMGITAVYDTRRNTDNPREGIFVQFQNRFYTKFLGSDYNYQLYHLDARYYINTYKDQTLALQALVSQRVSKEDQIPIRGAARLGSTDMLRGYFFGTYQAKNMLGFRGEYRLPIFNDYNAPVWKVWRHLGIVAFAEIGQAYDNWNELSFTQTRAAVGGGLRIMIDSKQRVNLQIDYGIGLDPNSSVNGIQSGFYFNLSETF